MDLPFLDPFSFNKFIERVTDEYLSCESKETMNLIYGLYHHKGKKGKVILEKNKAIKMNKEIGDYKFIRRNSYFSSFFLQYVISLLVEKVLSKKRDKNFVKCHTLYICGGKGFTIYEKAKHGDFASFLHKIPSFDLDDVVCSCLKSLSKTLSFLNTEYEFIHNDLKADNVLVDEKNGSLLFKISDFDNSSMTYEGRRYLQTKNILQKKISSTPKKHNMTDGFFSIEPKMSTSNNLLQGSIFRLSEGNRINIDLYTLVLTILDHPHVRRERSNMVEFGRYLKKLFREEDLIKIFDFIDNNNENILITTFVGYLINTGIWLKPSSAWMEVPEK
jgi:serine/threonine protein kinase